MSSLNLHIYGFFTDRKSFGEPNLKRGSLCQVSIVLKVDIVVEFTRISVKGHMYCTFIIVCKVESVCHK